ncbi:MAG TPA: hypothetical protein VG298_15015 [Acidimicrobiales bacterium]|nr:hypothetical protein [Acidimicrobiales bacterium]
MPITPRRVVSCALPIVLGAAAWHSIVISAAQLRFVPVPAALVGAPIAVGLSWVQAPRSIVTVADRDTDYICATITAALGSWLIYWPPGRLEGDFISFRPDLIGLALYVLALICLLRGTRVALSTLPSVAAAAAVACPALQLVLVGFSPTPGALGLFSGLLASLPLLLTRPFRLRVKARGTVLVVVVGGAVAPLGHLAHLGYLGSSLIAGGAALGGLGLDLGRQRCDPGRGRRPAVALTRPLLASVAAVLAGLAGLELLVPTAQVAGATERHGALVPHGVSARTYETAQGLRVTSWQLSLGQGENQAAMVTTTTGPDPAAVNTYPTADVVAWAQPACPNTFHYDLGAIAVSATERIDTTNGFRWDDYEWGWSTPAGYQRVALTLASGPSGEPVPLPGESPNYVRNTLGVVGQLVAGRHLLCGASVPRPGSAVGRLLAELVGSPGGSGAP